MYTEKDWHEALERLSSLQVWITESEIEEFVSKKALEIYQKHGRNVLNMWTMIDKEEKDKLVNFVLREI